MKAQRGNRGIAVLFIKPRRWTGEGGGWLFNGMPRPLHPRESDPVPIVQEAGWTPEPVWMGAENPTSHRVAIPRNI